MIRFFGFMMMSFMKMMTSLFYRFDIKWLSKERFTEFKDVRLIVFLNHTSLYETLFVKVAPFNVLWRLSRNLVVPGADETLKRPIVGTFIKALIPGVIPISRKRDNTWSEFMQKIHNRGIVAILPEGRMKRKDGLDKHGNPMTVRGGVADILKHIDKGKIMFVYSGGLHHVQAPGEILPKIFKKIKANLEIIDVEHYKERLKLHDFDTYKFKVIEDMQARLHNMVPFCEHQPANK